MNSDVFKNMPPTALFFRCAGPAMITMLFGSLYSVADGFFVGRFIGEDALDAVNLVMPVIMTVFAFSNMIATGASVRVSVLLGGKRDREEASRLFSCCIRSIVLISCALGAVGYLFAEPFMHLLAPGAEEQAIRYGMQYLRVYALFSPCSPFTTQQTISCVYAGRKNSAWPSTFSPRC